MRHQSLETFASISEPNKRYTKFQCIGRGASKVVYKGFDEVEGIEVAWNEVACSDWVLGSRKERQHVMGEIQMLRQLKHRNVMRLYDWWYDRQGQVLVFITELLTDGSLRRFIRRKHAAGITLSALKRYSWQILQGLVYLHGHYPPIIHRDLKCDNIFVNGAAGELKVGDLGFATLLKGMSAPLSVIGTPEFMAPELYDERYDEKVDIYSFGMCLLEMATQEYPYAECTNPAQIFRKVTNGVPPAAVSKVTFPALKDFILLTIQPDPHKRPEARQLLVHPFFEEVRQQIRSKGCLRVPPAAANAAAAAAAALAAAGMPAGEALSLDAAVVMGAGAAAGCLPAAHTPQSVPTGLELLVRDEAAAEAVAQLPPDAAAAQQHNQQFNSLTWGPTQSNSVAAAAAVMAAMAAAGQQQPELRQQQHLVSTGGGSSTATSSVLSTPMHSILSNEPSCSSMASYSSWGSREAFGGHSTGKPPTGRRSAEGRTSTDGRHSTDDLSEEDVLFDADAQEQQHAAAAADGDADEDAGAGGDSSKQAQQRARQQQQAVCEGGGDEDGVYLSPIREDEDEEEGVDCECRRIDQEQLSFNVGFFNAKGMMKRVGFQFNALEDTVESIGLEMVEQLALNPLQVQAIADKIRAALEALGINSNGTLPQAPGAPSCVGRQDEAAIGQTAAFAIVATAAATAAIEEAASPLDAALVPAGAGDGSGSGPGGLLPLTPFMLAGSPAEADGEEAAAAAAPDGPGSLGSHGSVGASAAAAAACGGGAAASGSSVCSRASSLGVSHSPGLMGLSSIHSSGPLLGGSSPTSLGLLGSSLAGGGGGDAYGGGDAGGMMMCPQQLVRQLSMLNRGTATALLANLQEDLLQQSYATPEAAAAIGFEPCDSGTDKRGAAAAAAAAKPQVLHQGQQQQHQQQQRDPLVDAVRPAEGGDKHG